MLIVWYLVTSCGIVLRRVSISSSPKLEQKELFSKSETKDANVGPTVNESKNGYVRTVSKPQRCLKGTSTTALAVIPVKVKAKGRSKMPSLTVDLTRPSALNICCNSSVSKERRRHYPSQLWRIPTNTQKRRSLIWKYST